MACLGDTILKRLTRGCPQGSNCAWGIALEEMPYELDLHSREKLFTS